MYGIGGTTAQCDGTDHHWENTSKITPPMACTAHLQATVTEPRSGPLRAELRYRSGRRLRRTA
nr:DUF6299 family protein [Streptomyces roseochromogenus]